MGKRVVVSKNDGSRTVVQNGRIVGNIGVGTRAPSPSGIRSQGADNQSIDGWVTCEVVSMDSDPQKGAWSKLGSDEIGWGYSVEYVPVYDQPSEDAEVVGVALACTWSWPQHRGEKISSGDWLTRNSP